jgi:hypothetical protein
MTGRTLGAWARAGQLASAGGAWRAAAREGRVRARVPRPAVQCGPSDEGEMERGWGRATARAWTPRAHVRRRVQEHRTAPKRGERDPNRSSPFSNGCELSAGSAEAMKWELEGLEEAPPGSYNELELARAACPSLLRLDHLALCSLALVSLAPDLLRWPLLVNPGRCSKSSPRLSASFPSSARTSSRPPSSPPRSARRSRSARNL